MTKLLKSTQLSYLSILDKKTKKTIYNRWNAMHSRCYSPSWHKRFPAYKDCIVCDEWHKLSNFYNWMITQDWKGKHLDKDLLEPNNKIYHPDKCLFIPPMINHILCNTKSVIGVHPKGVHFDKRTNKYNARVSIHARQISLGFFETVQLARQAYVEAKTNYIRSFYPKLTDKRIIIGLERHIEHMNVNTH